MRAGRIILIVVVLLLIGGIAGAGFFFLQPLKRLLGFPTDDTAAAAPPPKKVVKPEDVAFCDLPDIMITMAGGTDHRGHIVKMAISLELDDKTDQPRVNAYVPRVVDVLQVYVRQLSVEDVRDTESLKRVRDALLPRLNAALAPSHVDDVLFREVLVQ
jgi:flagellar FliL protein